MVVTQRFAVGFSAKYRLSPREEALLLCAISGKNNDEAAVILGCSRATIATYWNRIFSKVGRRSQRDVFCELLTFVIGESEGKQD